MSFTTTRYFLAASRCDSDGSTNNLRRSSCFLVLAVENCGSSDDFNSQCHCGTLMSDKKL